MDQKVDRVTPVWGYDADNNWTMLNKADFEVYRAAMEAARLSSARSRRKASLQWLFGPAFSGEKLLSAAPVDYKIESPRQRRLKKPDDAGEE